MNNLYTLHTLIVFFKKNGFFPLNLQVINNQTEISVFALLIKKWHITIKSPKKQRNKFTKIKQNLPLQPLINPLALNINFFKLNFLFKKFLEFFFGKKVNLSTKIVNWNAKVWQKKLKKLSQKSHGLQNNRYFWTMLKAFTVGLRLSSPDLISWVLAGVLERVKNQKTVYQILAFLVLYSYKLVPNKNIRIQIKGNLNDSDRTKSRAFFSGIPAVGKFSHQKIFSQTTSYTRYGSFGIKVWIF